MKSLVCVIVLQFFCSSAFALMSLKEAQEVRNWAAGKKFHEIMRSQGLRRLGRYLKCMEEMINRFWVQITNVV
jgi:hypothetical protein